MIFGRCGGVPVALAVALLALFLGGCSSSTPPPQALAPSPTSSLPAAPTSAPDTPASTTAATPSTDAVPTGGQCRLDDLGVQRADGTYEEGRNQVRVVWTNHSDRTCTMNGFGGVDVLNAQGERYSAARTDESPATVSLAPGGQAHSTISFPAAGGTGVFTPTAILATPPNETRSARLPWGTGGVPLFEVGGNSVELSISPVRPDAS